MDDNSDVLLCNPIGTEEQFPVIMSPRWVEPSLCMLARRSHDGSAVGTIMATAASYGAAIDTINAPAPSGLV